MSVHLIISDIDGCISPEESCAWDGALFGRFAELSRAASSGAVALAPLTLCTGRPQPYVEALMKILDIRYPAICEAGAVLYSLHDNCSRYSSAITQTMIQGLHRLRAHIISDILPDMPGLVYQFGKEAQLSLYSAQPECFSEATRRIEAHAATIPGLDIVITPTHYYMNIDLRGVTKGGAICGLQDELGLSKAECAGIGDTAGDLSIREAVGFFACPANAVDAVKRVADYVSPYPDVRGMLDIFERPEMQRPV